MPIRMVSVDGVGAGTGTTSGGTAINCISTAGIESGTCSEPVSDDTLVTLTATPSLGSNFTGWTGCDSPSGNLCAQTVAGGDETVQPSFGTVPEITVAPISLDFGLRPLAAGATASQDIVITNDGLAGLTITAVSLIGADAGEFAVTNDTGEGSLAPAASRTVSVAFDPSSLGSKSATLRILSDDSDEPTVDVPLIGVGDNRIFDYGDAPDSYATLGVSDGARHEVPDSGGVVFLGISVDTELDGQPSATAQGDDT
ncbi:MAG: choice-of-anchor D domain-containing protein, partial [Actinomycetia bacterium]|nr:choice-of-anchor D domain-containing protein [Actinomycetes bacterium]